MHDTDMGLDILEPDQRDMFNEFSDSAGGLGATSDATLDASKSDRGSTADAESGLDLTLDMTVEPQVDAMFEPFMSA